MSEAEAPAEPTGRIPVLSPSGKMGSIPASNIGKAQKAGFRVVSPEEARQQKLQDEYGGIGGMATTAAINAGDQLLLGGGKGLAVGATRLFGGDEAGNKLAENIEHYDEANPGSRLVGAGAGIAGLAALTSGLGTAAEGASAAGQAAEGASALSRAGSGIRSALTAVPRATEAIAGGAAQAAEHALPHFLQGSALGRIGVKGVESAVHAGVESVPWALGTTFSEQQLNEGNHPLTGEQMAHKVLETVLLGGAIGGTLGAGSQAFKEVLRGVGKPGAVEAIAHGAHPHTDAAGAPLAEAAEEGSTLSKKGLFERATGYETPTEALKGEANNSAWRAAGGTKKMTENVEKYFPGGVDALGEKISKELPEVVGKKGMAAMTREDMVEGASTLKKQVGQRIDEVISKADEAANAAEHHVTVGEVAEHFDNQLSQLKKQVGAGTAENTIKRERDRMLEMFGAKSETGEVLPDALNQKISFQELHDLRISISKNLSDFARLEPKAATRAFNAIDRGIEGSLEQGLKKVEPALYDAYKPLKTDYQAWMHVEKAATSGVSRNASNNFFGLGDRIGAGVGAGVGGLLGGGPGALLGTSLGGAISKAVNSRGDFLAAEYLPKLANLEAIQRMSVAMGGKIDNAAREYLTKEYLLGKTVAKSTEGTLHVGHELTAAKEGGREEYNKLTHEVSHLTNPQALSERMAPAANMLARVAPQVGVQTVKAVNQAVAFLDAKRPPERVDALSLTPLVKPKDPKYLTQDEAKFVRYAKAVANPLSLFSDMKQGKLSKEAVEAARVVYPELYKQMVTGVQKALAERKNALPYHKEVQLSLLLGAPTNSTLTPEFIGLMQKSAQSVAGSKGQGEGGPEGAHPPHKQLKMQQPKLKSETAKL